MTAYIKKHYKIIFYIILALSFFGVLMLKNAGFRGDDLWFREKAFEIPFFEYIRERYLLWSSRVLIEALEYFFVRHVFLWRLSTAIIYSLGMFLLSEMLEEFGGGRECIFVQALFTASLYAFPKAMFMGAGWISTTVNYLWTSVFLIICIYAMYRLVKRGEQQGSKLYVSGQNKGSDALWTFLSVISMIFCAFHEISCAIGLIFTLYFMILYIVKYRKLHVIFPVFATIDICGLINTFLCPGNKVRMLQETENWFPGFDTLSFPVKMEMGFSSTMQNFNIPIDPVGNLFFFFVLLAACVCIKKPLFKLIGVLPFLCEALINIFRFRNLVIPPSEFSAETRFMSTGTNPVLSDPVSLIPDMLFFIQILATVFVFYMLYKDSIKSFISVLVVLSAGFASRMSMSFSPTIWVSGIRTFMILYICLVFCIAVLGVNIYKKNRFLLLSAIPFIAFGIIKNII